MDGNHARALLGVPRHATTAQVRRAFRGAVVVAHPDRGGEAARFRSLVEARDLLLVAAVAPDLGTARAAEAWMTAVQAPPAPTFDVHDVPRPHASDTASPTAGPGDGPGVDFDAVLDAVLAAVLAA